HLLHRPRHRGALALEARLEPDVDLRRTDREGSDERALDELVRVGPQEGPVLEGARLALGPVAHQVAPPAAAGRDARPLATRGEPSPAAPPQPRARDLVDRRLRSERPG